MGNVAQNSLHCCQSRQKEINNENSVQINATTFYEIMQKEAKQIKQIYQI